MPARSCHLGAALRSGRPRKLVDRAGLGPRDLLIANEPGENSQKAPESLSGPATDKTEEDEAS